MLVELLALLVTIESGVVAGVFFAVAVSVIPALAGMPAGRYIEAHRALGHGYHPVMPIIVNSGTLVSLVLIFLAPASLRWLFIAQTVLLLGVQAVSHLCNVPINRRAKAVDPEAVPDDWDDPRTLWRNWHFLRTSLAFVLFVVSTAALMAL